MKRRNLTIMAATFGAALMLALTPACGGDDEGGSSGSGSGEDDGSSSSGSSSSCSNDFSCIGGGCECSTEGKQGQSCCDPDDCGSDPNNCADACEVCS